MKGKRLEIIVLVVAFALLSTAAFFMLKDFSGEAIKKIVLVNRIFSLGFIVYILYSYILSSNLNGEIRELSINIGNLKEEVSRKKKKIEQRDQTIAGNEKTIGDLNAQVDKMDTDAKSLQAQLANAKIDLKKLIEEKASEKE